MSFLRRLGIYLIGLSMGLVILAFFFRGKETSFCYFPNCRTLKDIRSKSVIVSKNIENQTYTIDYLKPIFWNGDVDFKRSDTKSLPCRTYVIIGFAQDDTKLEIVVKNCPKQAEIIEIKKL
ncbi:MAG: hypothetical protein Q3983_06045 [Capnocytophaga sp.]|nr:hypothetical protein [Capnocytophaga sp.]